MVSMKIGDNSYEISWNGGPFPEPSPQHIFIYFQIHMNAELRSSIEVCGFSTYSTHTIFMFLSSRTCWKSSSNIFLHINTTIDIRKTNGIPYDATGYQGHQGYQGKVTVNIGSGQYRLLTSQSLFLQLRKYYILHCIRIKYKSK